jgi:hypothetical protein
VTRYATTLDKRFAVQLADLVRTVRRLQARLVAIDSGAPLAALPGVVDAVSPLTVYLNGATTATACQNLASYSPTAGDSVLAIPLPLTAGQGPGQYVVIGKFS